MSLMDELVSAGVDSKEFLGNPLKHNDFVATNNLDDSSLSHSVCEDFTVDFTDMKDIYTDRRCKNLNDNVNTTNKNNSVSFENCTMNLEQELEHATTLTGSSIATTSNQESFQESNPEINSLNVRQDQVHAMSQLGEENINQVEVQEISKKPQEILSLEEDLSQTFPSNSKACDVLEMNESNSNNSYKNQSGCNIENYDGNMKDCDSEDTSNYENRVKKVPDIDDAVCDNKECSDDNIVDHDVSTKDHDGDNIGNDVTSNSNDHEDNEIDNDYGDGASKFLCGNLVDEYDVTVETDKDISSIVNNSSLERNLEEECTLIKDEINDGNSLGSHLIDTEKTRHSPGIAVNIDMTEHPTEIANDVDLIKTRSPTETDIDVDGETDIDVDGETDIDMDRIKDRSPTENKVDMIKIDSPVKNSNTINRFAAEETLNASIKTEPANKVTVDCNSATMSSVRNKTDNTNKSVDEKSVQGSQLEDCETFEDLYLQEKFLKREREMESLKRQLDDKQKVILQAVKFGKQLLEENEELKEKVDKLMQKTITIDEVMYSLYNHG